MDSSTGGQLNLDPGRQAAAQIARKKVLAAYSSATKNSESGTPNDPSHLKDQSFDSKINSESWKRYHSAWQNYYQKYYNDYYSNAAREYIAKERLRDARAQAEEEEIVYALAKAGRGNSNKTGLKLPQISAYQSSDNRGGKLRQAIRKKATDNAKKSRRFRKFIPVIAGLTVTLTILFLQYNRLIFAPIMAYVSPGNAPASSIEALDPTITQTVSSDPRLIIPKLNIDVPIRFNVGLGDIYDAMNNGVAHYRINGASAYPGEIGNFIITGHSAGDVYTANPYKYIFSGLERLEDGDLIYVNYESVRYTYRVTKKEVVEPTNVAALVVQTDKPLITLVTCTPLGTSRYRLLVTGEQISPVYDEAERAEQSANEATIITDDGSLELPSNEPSFFERIWNFLTGQ
ncbi:class E sortase [Candidatus Saccharibacteria bacterium]|nr:class E sortase [Candidatus Saccharibacteria bacterium]